MNLKDILNKETKFKRVFGMSGELPLMVSVSGGKTNAFMAIYLKNRFPNREMLFVFANTGKEKEETLDFLFNLDIHFKLGIVWLEALVAPEKGIGTSYTLVDFNSASRNGEPFEAVIKKYGLPSKLFRHCTRELKEKPIKVYATEILGKDYITCIGIRADESHRLSKKKNHWYPLSEINVTKRFINDWWDKQDFNLELAESEGNCDFCFLKSQRKRLNLLSNGLDVEWWNRMELKYGSERQHMFDVRSQKTIKELIEISNQMDLQLSAFDDVSFDCFCKN